MDILLAQALELWKSKEFQDLASPVLVLSSISAMFWMLARFTGVIMYMVQKVLPEELGGILAMTYNMALALLYATMMYFTALLGRWHPSLMWREMCGFVFMYVMLGAAYTDPATKGINPYARPGYVVGLLAYLGLAAVPSWVRHPALVEFHRVLEILALGGVGYVLTTLTVVYMTWTLFTRGVREIAFLLSPILFKLHLIKAPPIRLKEQEYDEDGEAVQEQAVGVVPSFRRALVTLVLLLAGAWAFLYWLPKLREGASTVAPSLQSKAQSPEAAAAAASLRRVLPEVSFTAVRTLPRSGPMARLAAPVFRKLLSAQAERDRWLAAAAMDRVDPSFRISSRELFRSSSTPALPCGFAGRSFQVLYQSMPGDDPAKSRSYWIEDGRGVHFAGIGPGEMQEVAASSGCAVAAFAAEGGAALLAFTEAAKPVGVHLWLSAYHPGEQAVLDSARVGESGTGSFELMPVQDGVSWADAPASSGTSSCSKDCGEVMGAKALAITTEGLAEYRSARVVGGAIKTVQEPNQTFARGNMKRFFGNLPAFEKAFQFDPSAGFLTRWYRLAKLADGRECLSLALDRSMPGFSSQDAWTCDR